MSDRVLFIMGDNTMELSPPPIGAQIRQLRQDRGLTLSAMARLAGTSVPAMHRYESGWDRFELSTLRKIAGAVGAVLEVRLVPAPRPESTLEPAGEALTDLLASVFWDRELKQSDLEDHRSWVLARALMFGNDIQVKAARTYFGDGAIRAAIRRREVDPRTRNYWTLMLGETCTPRS